MGTNVTVDQEAIVTFSIRIEISSTHLFIPQLCHENVKEYQTEEMTQI